MFVFAYLLAHSSTVHIYIYKYFFFLINLRWLLMHTLSGYSVIVMSKWRKTDDHLPCGIGTKIANRRGGVVQALASWVGILQRFFQCSCFLLCFSRDTMAPQLSFSSSSKKAGDATLWSTWRLVILFRFWLSRGLGKKNEFGGMIPVWCFFWVWR